MGIGAGFAKGVGFTGYFGMGSGLAAGLADAGFLVVETFFAGVDLAAGLAAVFFTVDGFFIAETFFAGVDLAADLAGVFFAVDGFFVVETFFAVLDFAAGLDVFLAGVGFVFFTGFAEDLLFLAGAGFLDGLTVLFVVFFFDVSFFTINTSFENLSLKYLINA